MGARPNTNIDIPVSAVLFVVFVILAILHMWIFKRNRRGTRVIFSGMAFSFCQSRALTFVLRILSAKFPSNVSLTIVASIFLSAGVVFLYALNLNYTQRIVRGYHPRFGHHRAVFIAFGVYYAILAAFLVIGNYGCPIIAPWNAVLTRAQLSCRASCRSSP